MKIKKFTFNGFSENTYIIYDDTKECIIIDPGCYLESEKEELNSFIVSQELIPVLLVNTHCHIDHIFGNSYAAKKWKIKLIIHQLDLELLKNANEIAISYGFTNYEVSPLPERFISEGENIKFGNSELNILFIPGHAPGHIALYSKSENFIISGDALFRGSIGRTDLPGGEHEVLLSSIREKLFILSDNTTVYCGHGPETTIGFEKNKNPFFK
jgi:hydroxyacylglutathione hydrolase